MKLVLTLGLFALWSLPLSAWWCEGHEAVALIAEHHLTPETRAHVERLLKASPTADPPFCKDSPTDPMAAASTWADDAKASEMTATWHYLNIPMALKKGDPEKFCEPVGPSHNGGLRPGCILSALRSTVDILISKDESDDEKAKALRYMIHFMGDLHQPLHTTSNNDQGGNCLPVQFFDQPDTTNLHSVWDGLIIERELALRRETVAQFAADVDQRFASKRSEWTKSSPQFDKWAWEGHLLAMQVAYGDLSPEPSPEKLQLTPNCDAEKTRLAALQIKISDTYEHEAVPVIEMQIAKDGYRLAEILNSLWP